jgi:cysteinyl-tRNA synthetase
MEWDSPWGKGFPGWHIECSAMAMKYLGETLDIHTGGIDHVPVHHTNEIAQSEAATGKRFALMWMHSNHVLINDQKISKSLGNGIRLADVVEKGYDPMVLRLHILDSHYRSQSKFSWESLESARNRLGGYRAMADLRFQPNPNAAPLGSDYFDKLKTSLLDALTDDLNTPETLRILNEAFDYIENHGRGIHTDNLAAFETFLKWLDDLLGLKLSERQDITGEQKQLIAEREEARKAKDWAKSDELRDKLTSQGIGLRDTPHGTIWYRIS